MDSEHSSDSCEVNRREPSLTALDDTDSRLASRAKASHEIRPLKVPLRKFNDSLLTIVQIINPIH
jgi:hypothetical protein